jgi:gas vesicle structural protein
MHSLHRDWGCVGEARSLAVICPPHTKGPVTKMAMAYERAPAGRSQQTLPPRAGVQKMGGASGLADVLNVILEKGIVIDAWVRVSIIGIEILTLEIRAVIASVDTYLRYAEAIGLTALAAAPRTESLTPAAPALLLPGLPVPSDEEILAYLEAHPDGVRVSELQAYFGADRLVLESILNRLADEDVVQRDRERGVYLPALVGAGVR